MKSTPNLEALEKALVMGKEELFAEIDRDLRRLRKALIEDLANVDDLESARIQKLISHFEQEAPAMLASAQRNLRAIWPRTTPLKQKQLIVDAWLLTATKRLGRASVHAWLAVGRLEFDYENFPGQFVLAILENWWKFQVCGNPDCVARYFLAKRSTQRYCERGACTQYANRRYALDYWNKKGKKRRTAERKEEVSL